jgi:hypothetical protein
MASVSRALERIKEDLADHLPEALIESACRDAGHRWRERKLGPVRTIHLFILQILNANTAITHLRHLAKTALNAGAYCKARMRLPLAVFQSLLAQSAQALRTTLAREAGGELSRWRGHRTLLVDGSSTIVPDTPALRRTFKQPPRQKKNCGFPVPKVLGLFDAMSGLVLEVLSFPLFTHEQARVAGVHPLLEAGDLLVGDRGLCSFVHLALLSARRVLACFRMHQSQIVNFRPHRKAYDRKKGNKRRRAQKGRPRSHFVRRLGKHDQLVRWIKPKAKDACTWMGKRQFAALPDELLVRELQYAVGHKGCRTRRVTVVTTLLDPALYSKESIAELYGIRWRIETHWRELKTTLNMRRIKCRTVAGVQKELAVYALVYNLVHAVMVRAAVRQKTTPDRISFTDALRFLTTAAPGEELPDLVINPPRPGRCEPRVIKDANRTYPHMKFPRPRERARLRRRRKLK